MRHRKDTLKLGRTSSHCDAMLANMTKSLILSGRIETTVPKAKAVRRHAERMITLAKQQNAEGQMELAAHRKAVAEMRVSYNELNPSQLRRVKVDDKGAKTKTINLQKLGEKFGPSDRHVMSNLRAIASRLTARKGGYTRIVRTGFRKGDAAELCVLEFLDMNVETT